MCFGYTNSVINCNQMNIILLPEQLASIKNSPIRQPSVLSQSVRYVTSLKSTPSSPMRNSPTLKMSQMDHIPSPLAKSHETVVNMDPNILSVERVASPELLITKLVMEASKQLEVNKLASLSSTSITVMPRVIGIN